MVERRKSTRTSEGAGNYFAGPNTSVEFVRSGCKVLDLALGGGWAEGRIANIVGDKSTGKTLQCIEAAANFVAKYEDGEIKYREIEAAFDPGYAAELGMPLDRVDFGKEQLNTVEDVFEDLGHVIEKADHPILYVVDSLDALSDRAEMVRGMDEGTYGAEKAKKMGQLFRRLVRPLEKSKITVLIVSQVRSKIGISFGRSTTRSGGRALDFYASQVLYLSHLGIMHKTIGGVKRPYGIEVRAKVDKNKIGMPFREAQYPILFGFGIDDAAACINYLIEAKALDRVDLSSKEAAIKYLSRLNKVDDDEYRRELKKLRRAVQSRWYEVENSFLPKRRKYG